MQATAVIVTYNSGAHVRAAIDSCLAFGVPVLVVDNASSDDTLAAIPPGVRVIANPDNRGFAAAVNQGVAAHGDPLTLLLNPDARLLTPIGTLCRIVTQNRHTAAAGLLLEAPDQPQKGFTFRRLPTPAALALEVLGVNRIWPHNPINRAYRCVGADLARAQTVEQPAGAFLLFRRDDWAELGGFDEGFFPVWFEDVDFCKRLLDLGGVIYFDPSVRALHEGGHSVQKIPGSCQIRFWYGSLLRYAVRHFSRWSARGVALAVATGAAARMVLASAQGRDRSVRSAYFHSIRLAGRVLMQGRFPE